MIKERVLLCSDAYLVWVAFELSHLTWRPRRMTWDCEDGQEKRKGNKQRGLSRYQEAKEKVGSEGQETFQNSDYHPCETGEWNPGNGLGWEEIASWERNTVAYHIYVQERSIHNTTVSALRRGKRMPDTEWYGRRCMVALKTMFFWGHLGRYFHFSYLLSFLTI